MSDQPHMGVTSAGVKRSKAGQELIDRINGIGLTVTVEQIREIMFERVNMIDMQLASVLVGIVEFDDTKTTVHETGDTPDETIDNLEMRRNRIFGYMADSGIYPEVEDEPEGDTDVETD